MSTSLRHTLFLMHHPYGELTPLLGGREEIRARGRQPGTALVWTQTENVEDSEVQFVARRPGGLPLLVVLPPVHRVELAPRLVHQIDRCRPHGVLPHHDRPSASELAHVLRRPPQDLGAEVTDYLSWRGISLDRDMIRLVRQTLDLSAELKSITALARGMYLSRRALGRRFTTRGLPVPSHWLQLGRLLRVAIELQNTDESVFTVAYRHGYTDGFAVSNQMLRLIGCRPSAARRYLGWEWLMEEWLRKEAEAGMLAPTHGEAAVCQTPAMVTRHRRDRSRRFVRQKAAS